MKNLIATAIIFSITSASSVTASASSVTASFTKEPEVRKVDANNIHTASKSFGVGMYPIKGTETVKLLVETNGKLSVKVTDEKGNVLSREAMKNSSSMNINLAEAPSGNYFVEISNGIETITRQIAKNIGVVSAQ